MFRLSLFLMTLIMSGCANQQPVQTNFTAIEPVEIIPPFISDAQWGTRPEIPDIQTVLALSEQQKADFLSKYNSAEYSNLLPNRRISKYLTRYLSGFNFYSETLTSTEVLESKTGNCLSLAYLTSSLAQLADVEIAYQLVETPPIFQKEGSILLSSQHVRTVLFDPKRELPPGSFTIWRGKVTIDYFPTAGTRTLRRVEQDEFYSMYYRNLAAESLFNGDENSAYWYVREALKYKIDDGQAVNILAVLYSNKGHIAAADATYRFGIRHGKEKLSLFTNYHKLLLKLDRKVAAAQIKTELDKLKTPNPFRLIKLADSAYKTKKYSKAIQYYQQAAEMADYLHQPYAGMARAYHYMGKERLARRAIKKAIDRSHREPLKAAYNAKYQFFSKILSNQ